MNRKIVPEVPAQPEHSTVPTKQVSCPKENEKSRGKVSYVVGFVAAGTVLALIVAIGALAIKFAISQTELKFLQQQINNLREMLNQTDMKQATETEQLQQMLDINTGHVEGLANQLSTLEEDTQTLVIIKDAENHRKVSLLKKTVLVNSKAAA